MGNESISYLADLIIVFGFASVVGIMIGANIGSMIAAQIRFIIDRIRRSKQEQQKE